MGDRDDDKHLSVNIGVQGALIACGSVSILGIAADIPSNGLSSPLGTAAMTAMLKVGAGPETKKHLNIQIIELPDEKLYNGFQLVLQSLAKIANELNFDLKMKKRLFVKNNLNINENFGRILKQNFDTLVIPVDFSKTKQTIHEINQWSSQATNNKIAKFCPDNSKFPIGLEVLMLDVVYFKGLWAQGFDPSKTKEDLFFIKSGEGIKTTFMNTFGKFMTGNWVHYDAANNDSKIEVNIISIPFKGDRLRMIVYLPGKEKDLRSVILEARDPSIFLPQLLHLLYLKEKNVNLSLPKFSCDTISAPYIPLVLAGFDIPQPMDWSGMGRESNGNTVSYEGINARQKILFEFDEQGGGNQKFEFQQGEDVLDFKIDRPFFYSICDMYADVVLLQGKCYNPLDATFIFQ